MTQSAEPVGAACSACGAEIEADATACFHCGHVRRSPPLKKGQVIADRYELRGVLGRGGMGTVYEAYDRSLDERVALKVLSETAQGSADADRRFRAEIKLARRIRHPNVCAIHEYGELQDLQYIVMELVTGQDLKKHVRSVGPLTTRQAVDFACQIGEGLQAIHDAGVIHRDLKLSNVMIDSVGRIRLMDFGIAKGIGDTMSTVTGQILGTPEYMSPEQVQGQPVDPRADIYALAIMTYELLTGRVPFKADTPLATIMLQVQEPPPLQDPAIPRGLVPVLAKGLAKRPDDRFDTARAYVEALAGAPLSQSSKSPAAGAGARVSAGDIATIDMATPRPPLVRHREAPRPQPPAKGRTGPVVLGLIGAAGLVVVLGTQLRQRAMSNEVASFAPETARSATPAPDTRRPVVQTPEPASALQATPMDLASPSVYAETTERTPKASSSRSRPSTLAASAESPILHREPTPPLQSPTPLVRPASSGSDGQGLNPRAPATTPLKSEPPPRTPEPSGRQAEPEKVPPTGPSDGGSTRETKAAQAPEPAPSPLPASSTGLLQLGASPYAQVFIDGKDAGTLPFRPIALASGRYVVRFVHPSYQPLQRTVSVRPGETTKLFVDWSLDGIPK